MIEIINRRPAYTDEMMLNYCNILDSVVSKTKKINKGRGRSAVMVDVPVHNFTDEVKQRIKNSLEHYKNKDMLELRDYQKEIIEEGTQIVKKIGFLYLAMEVRTGKTLTSLGICEQLNVDNVLFLTKKKAIGSISDDYTKMCPANFALFTINYESIHKIPDLKWDVIICDEAHSMGAFAKPSNRAKDVKGLIQKNRSRVILLSGTPTPESYSQMYHQVYGIPTNPFSQYKNFYRFCDDYVNVTEKRINSMTIKDYSKGYDTIVQAMSPYTINYTQSEAGFKVETKEHILSVDMKPVVHSIAKNLQKNLVVEGKDEVILADTPVKLMSKLHQIYSGTVKFESGKTMTLDDSKAEYIRDKFKGKKIGIFYKFKQELKVLMSVYGTDYLTTDLSVFNDTNKSIALQIVSGREGISLRKADALVYYNIDFSATSYWQSRDRMTTKDRLKNDVYWVFSKGGIEREIYKAVSKKKDYTIRHFKRDLLSLVGDGATDTGKKDKGT
tara:strand:- start:6214 stop:7707 length:1494 start_codon:yes stop_codon:yes gene_type:complete